MATKSRFDAEEAINRTIDEHGDGESMTVDGFEELLELVSETAREEKIPQVFQYSDHIEERIKNADGFSVELIDGGGVVVSKELSPA
jgi:hypothetical protein